MRPGWGKRIEEARLSVGKGNKTTFPYEIGSNRNSWAKFEAEEGVPDLEILSRLKSRTGFSLDYIESGIRGSGGIDASLLRAAIKAGLTVVDSARLNGAPHKYTDEEFSTFVVDTYEIMIKERIDGINSAAQVGVGKKEETPSEGPRKANS